MSKGGLIVLGVWQMIGLALRVDTMTVSEDLKGVYGSSVNRRRGGRPKGGGGLVRQALEETEQIARFTQSMGGRGKRASVFFGINLVGLLLDGICTSAEGGQ